MAGAWLRTRLRSRARARRLYREGLARVEQLDLVGCEAAFTASLAAARAGGSALLTGRAGEQLYTLLRRTRRLEEAVGLAQELVACHARLRGVDDDDTAAWRNELILLLGHLGRYVEAEPVCRTRLAAARRRHGDPASRPAWPESPWAGVFVSSAATRRRRAPVERPCPAWRRCSVPQDDLTGWALGGLAEVLARRGETELAEAALRRAQGNWDRVGSTEMATATLERLMDLYVASERYQDALAISQRRLASPGRLAAEMAHDRLRQLTNLERHGFLLRVTGRPREAEGYESRAELLRRVIEENRRPEDGASARYDPTGPVFDRQPVLDWGLATPVLARRC